MNRFHGWLCRSVFWKVALKEKLLPWLFEGVNLGTNLIEIGPGPGLTTDFLRQRVAKVTAIEVDPVLASKLKQRLAGTNVRVIEGNATAMPFEDETFSGAVALTMLHHVPSSHLQDCLLAEVYRVLQPGGTFAGMDNTLSWVFKLIHINDTLVAVDPQTFYTRLEAAGFVNIKINKTRTRFRFVAAKP